MILLVRHGWAGRRKEWEGDDRLRPLDERGHRQALALADLLAPLSPRRILSSPYLRCLETVEPLAAALGLPVEPREEFREEHQQRDGLALLRGVGAEAVVLCTHGGDPWTALAEGREYEKGAAMALAPELRLERYWSAPA